MVAQVKSFGRYDLEGLIGRGGMGEVYRAYDRDQRRVVALKLLPESLASDAAFVERFRRESYAAARLRDPHVLPIHQYGEIDGRLYIDMRLVDGRDLNDMLQHEGPFEPARAVHVIRQTAQALDAAHADNLVHRDVKPSNILITNSDFAYLVDFGIAHAIGKTTAGTSLTATGSTVGTLGYMAPERFSGRDDIDGRADVYALTCVLFEILTGRRPFPFDDLPSLLNAHLNTPPPKVTDLRPELPAALDEVIARGMAKDVDTRYPTPSALANAASAAVGGSPLPPVPAPVSRPTVTPQPVPPQFPTPHNFYDAPPTYIPEQRPPSGGHPPPRPAEPPQQRSGSGFGIWVVASVSILLAVLIGGGLVIVFNLGEARTSGTGTSSTSDPAAATGSASPGAPTAPVLPPAQTIAPETQLPPEQSGDLGLSVPVSTPVCDGSYGVFVGGSVDPSRYAADIQGYLDRNPGSRYLYGERACSSIRARDERGNSVYAVYYGQYPTLSQACEAQRIAGGSSYVRIFDNTTPVGTNIAC